MPEKGRRPEGRTNQGDARRGPDFGRLGDVLDFMRLLWAVDHGLQSISKRMEGTHGVTGPQRLVIRLVGRYPGISAGRLAQALHIDPSTLTGILKRLETRGILKRAPDPKDGRRALFSLTTKGRDLDTLRKGTVEASVRRALSRLSDDQIETTEAVLTAISQELDRA